MTAAAGDWLAVPRRGRVEEAVGAALEVVREAGAARDRRRGMVVYGGGERDRRVYREVGGVKDRDGVR